MRFALGEIIAKGRNTSIVPPEILTEMIPLAIRWSAMESIQTSNSAIEMLECFAQVNSHVCETVVAMTMAFIKSESGLSTTHLLRFLALFCKIMEGGSELSNICMRHGCPEAVMRAVEQPDVLVQVYLITSFANIETLRLFQLVALDLVPSLAASHDGLHFLVTQKHLKWLVDTCSAPSGSIGDLIRTQSMSVAATVLRHIETRGHSCRREEDYCREVVPAFLRGIETALEARDEPDRAAGLTAITLFATASPEAFSAIISCNAVIESWLQLLRGQPSVQGACLHSLGTALTYPSRLCEDGPNSLASVAMASFPLDTCERYLRNVSTETATQLQECASDRGMSVMSLLEELSTRKKDLFDRIGVSVGGNRGVSTMEYLMKLTKVPISEVKLGAMDVLRALAYQETPWGLHKLIGTTGFYHFLKVTYFQHYIKRTMCSISHIHCTPYSDTRGALHSLCCSQDRTTEYTKEGKIWKFSLITGVASSPHADLLSEDVSSSILNMLQQGPFFMPPMLEEPMTQEL